MWRSGGSVIIGAALSAFLSTPYGLIITPVLQGISKGIKKYFDQEGKPVPKWVGRIPF